MPRTNIFTRILVSLKPARFCYFMVTTLLFMHVAGALVAQDEMRKDTTTVTYVPTSILMEDISQETENTLLAIDGIKTILHDKSTEYQFNAAIPDLLQSLEELRQNTDLTEIDQLDPDQARKLMDQIAPLSLQLNNFMSSINTRIRILGKAKINIESQKGRWDLTKAKAIQEHWLPALHERIDENLTEIEDVVTKLSSAYNKLILKQNELTNSLIYLSALTNSIQSVQDQYISRVFTFNAPPIWQIFTGDQNTLSVKARFDLEVDKNLRVVQKFTETNRKNIYYHLLFAVFVFVITYLTKKEVSKWSDAKKDSNIQTSLFIINHPVSATILIAILSTRFFYPHIPEEALDYYYFLLIIPIILLIPGIFPTVPKKYFIYIGISLVIFQFVELFSEMEVIDRLAMLLLSALSLVFLSSFLYNKSVFEKEAPQINWSRVGFLIKNTMVIISLSIVLNLLGNTIIAEILTGGAFSMVFGGVIIFSTLKVVRSLFSLLLQHSAISSMKMIVNHGALVKEKTFRFFSLVAWMYWIITILNRFLILDPIYDWVSGILGRQWQLGSLELSIGSILAFFVTIWASILISKFTRFLLQEEILTHFNTARGVPGAISLIVRLSLIVIGFTIALGVAKIDLSNITIIFGALGVGIGFGLQNIFNNLVSGLILVFERPIQVGDVVQISTLNITGEVKEIGFRASIIQSFEGAEVIVPNGNLISNDMINWTLSDKRRRQELLLGVAYGTDTVKVLRILNEVVVKDPLVLEIPAPLCIFIGFGQSSLDFRVLFWTHYENGLVAKSTVGMAIDDAFRKAGIEIPIPQRDIHIKTSSTEYKQDDHGPLPIKQDIKQTGRDV